MGLFERYIPDLDEQQAQFDRQKKREYLEEMRVDDEYDSMMSELEDEIKDEE